METFRGQDGTTVGLHSDLVFNSGQQWWQKQLFTLNLNGNAQQYNQPAHNTAWGITWPWVNHNKDVAEFAQNSQAPEHTTERTTRWQYCARGH